MKKTKIKSILLILLLLRLFESNIKAQTYGNLVSIISHGSTDTADYAPILINSDGKVVVAGNQYAAANQQYDATLSAELTTGVLDWQSTVGTGNKAFNTASTHDGSGNLYVCGAIQLNPTNGFDYFVAKYTASGTQLWIQYYNGTNSTQDVASAICLDGSGNVYVTGGSEGTGFSLVDIVTIKYNSTGTQQWVKRYDYASSMDIPVAISFNTSGSLLVSGSSGSTYTSWDYLTLQYAPSSGLITNSSRTPSSGLQDMVTSMATDGSGNVYVTGTTSGANPNVRTLKLGTALSTVWTRTLDLHGYNDAGVGVVLDASNNVIITGFSYLANGTKELFVTKYNNSGTLQWTKTKKDAAAGSTAEGLRVAINTSGDIFVGGNYTTGGNQDVIVLRYNTSGKLIFERRYNGTANNTDKFMDLTVDGNNVYVSAKTYSTPTVDQNITIQYTTKTFTNAIATTTNSIKYEPTDLIIRFHKSSLKMSVINNKEIQYGKLSDFVNDSTCTKITSSLDPTGHLRIDAKNFDTRKIFRRMTEADSLAESRLGGMVKIQPYYCTLLLRMPVTVNNITAAQSLQYIKPDIHHTEMNVYLQTASANDTYFATQQAGLHTFGTYSNSTVNADSAWAIKGGGEPFIKVGVIDTGVDFNHPDLGSVPSYGGDYYNGTGPSGDGDDHGTGTAGVIAAVRNNNMGIAGIAGKDALGTPQGITLYDCKACENAVCLTTSVADALQASVQSFNCNVINMSMFTWSNFENSYGSVPAYTTMIGFINDANRLGIALVGAKGNLQSLAYPHSLPNYTFPADYTDQVLISVGSSGRDGHYCVYGVNCSNESTSGGNIDFVAPGTDSLVYSLDNNQGYKQVDGTSFATPHITGAVALMMSYRNNPLPNWNNMAPVDCERILERTATDLQQGYPYQERVGWDTVTGNGRINIMFAMRKIDKDYYRFRHITESIGCTSSSRAVSTISTNAIMNWSSIGSFPTGTTSTDVYQLTSTINYALLPTETLIDVWPLYKECYGSANESEVFTDRPYYAEVVSWTSTQAIVRTFYYRYNSTGVYAPLPAANQHSCAITLYTYDSSGSVNIQERTSTVKGSCKVYPNPSNGEFKVDLWSDSNTSMTYRVSNIVGQAVLDGEYKAQTGENKFALDATSLNQGMYIFTIFSGNKPVYSQKIIKQ